MEGSRRGGENEKGYNDPATTSFISSTNSISIVVYCCAECLLSSRTEGHKGVSWMAISDNTIS